MLGIVMTAFWLGLLMLGTAAMLAASQGRPDRLAEASGLSAFVLVLGSWGLYYVFLRGPMDALHRGFFLTDEVFHFNGFTIAVSSILRAELVRFAGYRDLYLAVDHVGKNIFGGRWVWTALIGSKDTASIEVLRDAVRYTKVWPPQVVVTESTWRQWRRRAVARVQGIVE